MYEKLNEKNCFESWKDYILNKIFEPNCLTDEQIKELCYEFYENFIATCKRNLNLYPNPPKIEIWENFQWWHSLGYNGRGNNIYKRTAQKYREKIEKEIGIYNNIKRPRYTPIPTGSHYSYYFNRNSNFAGVVCYGYQYDLIYYVDFLGSKLSDETKKYWSWYKKALNVIAIYYDKQNNTCTVIKKPDKWVIEGNNMYYKYGEKEIYLMNNISVPKWLYVTPAEELNPKDIVLCTNTDVRTEFVRKIGINAFMEYGKIVDTYENYPENEMWAKSEYKIIDMHEILPQRQIVDQWGYKRGEAKPYKYAPFLYMKNQTTGVYHLEGLHPRCKTLYDAIKMRYNGLNIKDFEIKDIK